MKPCEAPECVRPARAQGRYCEAHYKRLQRGQPLTEPIDEALARGASARTAEDAFWESVIAYANAEADEEYERQRALVRKWARRVFGVPAGRPPVVDVRRAVELYRQAGVRGAARALGVSRNAVRRALDRAGVRRFRTPRGSTTGGRL